MSKRIFDNEQDFQNKLEEYVDYCYTQQRYPNVAGFCSYMGINRDSFYAQKEYYSDTFKKIQDILEDEAINNPFAKESIKIFYLKNKFGYADKIESVVNSTESVTMNLSNLSEDELKTLKDLTKKAQNE